MRPFGTRQAVKTGIAWDLSGFACELAIFFFKPFKNPFSRNTRATFFTLLKLLAEGFELYFPQFLALFQQA